MKIKRKLALNVAVQWVKDLDKTWRYLARYLWRWYQCACAPDITARAAGLTPIYQPWTVPRIRFTWYTMPLESYVTPRKTYATIGYAIDEDTTKVTWCCYAIRDNTQACMQSFSKGGSIGGVSQTMTAVMLWALINWLINMTQCVFLIKCQSPNFVIYMLNLSTICCRHLQRVNVSYQGDISLPSLYNCRTRSPLLWALIRNPASEIHQTTVCLLTFLASWASKNNWHLLSTMKSDPCLIFTFISNGSANGHLINFRFTRNIIWKHYMRA